MPLQVTFSSCVTYLGLSFMKQMVRLSTHVKCCHYCRPHRRPLLPLDPYLFGSVEDPFLQFYIVAFCSSRLFFPTLIVKKLTP